MAERDSPDPESNANSAIAFASEFAAASREAWESLVGDLDSLRATTYEGSTIEPLYTTEDGVEPPGLPGFAPCTRGRTPASTRRGGWDVRQIVDHHGDRRAVSELELGATSLLIDLRATPRIDGELLGEILDGVLLDAAPVVLDAGDRWLAANQAFRDAIDRQRVDPAAVRGSFGADPLGAWASARDRVDVDRHLVDLARAASRADEYPGVRLATIDGASFHGAGGSDAQELGLAIADAVATMRALMQSATPVDANAAFGLFELRFAATADQFATIAKFRAARRLWSRVAEIAGVPRAAAQTPVHAISSTAMMTRYDPAVNILRGTVACFAAAVGGADSITVLPHDYFASPGSSEIGRRLARNTQSILALESHLAEVIDPAGGSWYVERLTAELARAAWDEFQVVEQAGGFRAAVERGIVQERLATVRDRRRGDIATRRAPITGVTEFPNIHESQPHAPPLSPVVDRTNSLGQHRWADEVESLRQAVDVHTLASGARPSVFLATIGAPASFASRATFAKNFFEVAGIATRLGPASDDPTTIAAAFGSGVACICSSDLIYRQHAGPVATALAEAGATRVYLSDPPAELAQSLLASGVTHTIACGDDLVAALTDLADHLLGPPASTAGDRRSVLAPRAGGGAAAASVAPETS